MNIFSHVKPLSAVLLLLMVISITSCEDEESQGPVNPASLPEISVLVANEGGFGQSNSSISIYDPVDEVVQNLVFQQANGYSLGDILQSVTQIDNDIYAVVNNSGRIDVLDKDSLVSSGPILGLGSPRNLVPAGDTRIYVTDLFDTNVDIVNTETKLTVGNIDLGVSSEDITRVGDFAYISSTSGNHVYVVNTNTDQLIDSIEVGIGGGEIATYGGQVFLLRSELDLNFNIVSLGLVHIDTFTNTLVDEYPVPQPWNYTTRLVVAGSLGERLLVLNQSVFEFDINQLAFESEATVQVQTPSYGLGVDPIDGNYYVGDAGDFVSPGKVYRYDASGLPVDTFEVGVIPNGFLFLD